MRSILFIIVLSAALVLTGCTTRSEMPADEEEYIVGELPEDRTPTAELADGDDVSDDDDTEEVTEDATVDEVTEQGVIADDEWIPTGSRCGAGA